MNIEELKKIFDNCEIIDEKIFVQSNVFKLLDFVKNSLTLFNVNKICLFSHIAKTRQ